MAQSIKIELYCDGWRVYTDSGKSFSWDHNDEDLGTEALKAFLSHLGYEVTVKECY